RRRRKRVVRQGVQDAELGLEVVRLEETRDWLALRDVTARLAAELDVEAERLLREAFGGAREPRDACGAAGVRGQKALEPSAELAIVEGHGGGSMSAARSANKQMKGLRSDT